MGKEEDGFIDEKGNLLNKKGELVETIDQSRNEKINDRFWKYDR